MTSDKLKHWRCLQRIHLWDPASVCMITMHKIEWSCQRSTQTDKSWYGLEVKGVAETKCTGITAKRFCAPAKFTSMSVRTCTCCDRVWSNDASTSWTVQSLSPFTFFESATSISHHHVFVTNGHSSLVIPRKNISALEWMSYFRKAGDRESALVVMERQQGV